MLAESLILVQYRSTTRISYRILRKFRKNTFETIVLGYLGWPTIDVL